MGPSDLIAGLPGEELLRRGLADLEAGLRTIPACLAAMARPRLVQAGLLPPAAGQDLIEPELELYRLLRAEGGDSYSRYNALLGELVSFEQTLDSRLRRGQAAEGQRPE
jgi:hypothetical protein